MPPCSVQWFVANIPLIVQFIFCSFLPPRIRRMTEGNVFTLSTIAGWGYHHLADRGVPPSQVGGYPLPGPGGWQGVPPFPHPGWGGGYPFPTSRRGVPPFPDPGGGGGEPQLKQYSVYLLHGRRYASCVHAGGLSCFICFFAMVLTLTWKKWRDEKHVALFCKQIEQARPHIHDIRILMRKIKLTVVNFIISILFSCRSSRLLIWPRQLTS